MCKIHMRTVHALNYANTLLSLGNWEQLVPRESLCTWEMELMKSNQNCILDV